jgi:UDP-glucose 4-epimerase
VKYVVTREVGFIGSHQVEALVDRGISVLVLEDLSTGSLANPRRGPGLGTVRTR